MKLNCCTVLEGCRDCLLNIYMFLFACQKWADGSILIRGFRENMILLKFAVGLSLESIWKGSGMMVGPADDAEKSLHTDNMVSDFVSLNTILPEVLDDIFLFRWTMLGVLLWLWVHRLSSRACVNSSSLALLFSMSLCTIGEVYVTQAGQGSCFSSSSRGSPMFSVSSTNNNNNNKN